MPHEHSTGGAERLEGCERFCSGRDVVQSQALSIRNCTRVTDEGVRGLAAARPRLLDLALDDDRSVTAAGISALAESCPNLQVAHLLGSLFELL